MTLTLTFWHVCPGLAAENPRIIAEMSRMVNAPKRCKIVITRTVVLRRQDGLETLSRGKLQIDLVEVVIGSDVDFFSRR